VKKAGPRRAGAKKGRKKSTPARKATATEST
jgi:hypothetical protein